MSKHIITQAQLKERLHYNPNTGIFTRIKGRHKSRIGKAAGYNHHGYIRIKIMTFDCAAHRLAFLYMLGAFPVNQVDHINQTKTDNRWCNLRDVTQAINNRNASRRADNESGATGVCWDKRANKWQAYIQFEKRRIHLGFFKDFETAASVRKEAENKYGFHSNHGSD